MNAQIAGLGVVTWVISIFLSFAIWILFIRPYIRKNGRSTGSGANYGWAAITDASIADEICKKNGKHPWFMKVFWIAVFLEFALPASAFIAAYFINK
jgi:hypothetical protein